MMPLKVLFYFSDLFSYLTNHLLLGQLVSFIAGFVSMDSDSWFDVPGWG